MEIEEKILQSIHWWKISYLDDDGIFKTFMEVKIQSQQPKMAFLASDQTKFGNPFPFGKLIDVLCRKLISEYYERNDLPDFGNRHINHKDNLITQKYFS